MSVRLNLFLNLLLLVQGKRNYEMFFENFEFKSNDSSIIADIGYSLEKRNNHKYGTAYLQVMKSWDKIPLRILVDIYQENKPRWNLFDMKIDLCEVLKFKAANKIFELILKQMKSAFGELPTCPLKPYLNYTMNNLHYDPENFPANPPEAKYRTVIYYFYKERIVANMIMEVNVVYKLKKKMRQH